MKLYVLMTFFFTTDIDVRYAPEEQMGTKIAGMYTSVEECWQSAKRFKRLELQSDRSGVEVFRAICVELDTSYGQ